MRERVSGENQEHGSCAADECGVPEAQEPVKCLVQMTNGAKRAAEGAAPLSSSAAILSASLPLPMPRQGITHTGASKPGTPSARSVSVNYRGAPIAA
jgi:hypothetical protein